MDIRGRPDAELVVMTLGGDTEAYGALVERYQKAVHGLVYAVVAASPEAEDLVQEAFLRAYLSLGDLRDAARFAPWLRRVATTVCLNWVERHRPERARVAADLAELDAPEPSEPAPNDPASMLERAELTQAVHDALGRLPARVRVPVVMFYLDGETYESAAAVLGRPIGTVKSLVHRGREMLRADLEKRLADPMRGVQRHLEARRLAEDFAMSTRAIIEAARAGRGSEVKELLARDRRLADSKGEYDKTALHWAAERNDAELCELLVAAGADIELRTTWGATALEWAVNLGSAEVAEMLLARGNGGMNLWIAAGLGKLDEVRGYLDGPSPPAARPVPTGEAAAFFHPESPLMTGDAISDAFIVACRNGHEAAGELLLDRGAKIDARGYFGGTALHWAAHNGHLATVEMLARRGAHVSLRDARFEATAAGWAIENEHRGIAARLIELGARVTLTEAANYGNVAAVRRLLDEDPKRVDENNGWGTALHEASFFGHREIVALLLERGANRDATTCRGETPLALAQARGHLAVIELLEKPGA